MYKMNRTIWLRSLSVLLCLLIASGQVEAMVLCVGHGGHLEVEVAGHDACCEHEEPVGCDDGYQHEWQLQADEDCHSCWDIPLTFGVGGVYNLSSVGGHFAMAVSLPAILTNDANLVYHGSDDVLPCLARQQLISLQTVILLM